MGHSQERLKDSLPGFAFCFVAGKTTSHTAKKFIGKLWLVVTNSPSRAHLCDFSGKLAPALAK
jgi:hypothetical protein